MCGQLYTKTASLLEKAFPISIRQSTELVPSLFALYLVIQIIFNQEGILKSYYGLPAFSPFVSADRFALENLIIEANPVQRFLTERYSKGSRPNGSCHAYEYIITEKQIVVPAQVVNCFPLDIARATEPRPSLPSVCNGNI
jgi:hypothetical protein